MALNSTRNSGICPETKASAGQRRCWCEGGLGPGSPTEWTVSPSRSCSCVSAFWMDFFLRQPGFLHVPGCGFWPSGSRQSAEGGALLPVVRTVLGNRIDSTDDKRASAPITEARRVRGSDVSACTTYCFCSQR